MRSVSASGAAGQDRGQPRCHLERPARARASDGDQCRTSCDTSASAANRTRPGGKAPRDARNPRVDVQRRAVRLRRRALHLARRDRAAPPIQAKVPVHIGGGGPNSRCRSSRASPIGGTVPGDALDRLDELRPSRHRPDVEATSDRARGRPRSRRPSPRRCTGDSGRGAASIAGTAPRSRTTIERRSRAALTGSCSQFSDFGTSRRSIASCAKSRPGAGGERNDAMTPTMTVGIPPEVKTDERRVAITPDGVTRWRTTAWTVLVEPDAGVDSGHHRRRLPGAGAEIVERAADAWAAPASSSRSRNRSRRSSASCAPTSCCSRTCTWPRTPISPGVSSTPARPASHTKPSSSRAASSLLAPMSEVAGRMAPQIGAHFLERRQGGGACCSAARPASPGAGRGARRGQRRLERGVDRAGHGSRGAPARPEPRPAAVGRPDPQGPHPNAREQPRRRDARRYTRPTSSSARYWYRADTRRCWSPTT